MDCSGARVGAQVACADNEGMDGAALEKPGTRIARRAACPRSAQVFASSVTMTYLVYDSEWEWNPTPTGCE